MALATPSHPCNALRLSLCAAGFFASAVAGCSHERAFVTADYAKCQELGFRPGDSAYDVCLLEVQRRRTALAAAPEELRD